MQPLQFAVPVGALDALEPYIAHVVLALVVVNMFTRIRAHAVHEQRVEDGADDLSRYLPHSLSTIALVLASFAFLVVEPHGGMVMAVIAVGLFLTDFFEFESRQVEARNDMTFERPKGAVAASLLALLYAGYQSLFVFIQPLWRLVV
ncbi:hypothetical protein SAMN04488065_0907 [Haloplanus vescus]|uniref:DUF7313 domain-containing protein n=1 Tax=Haloplanus vescus TaxID=555874 RepID=A0A1H3WL22_9EURY|nr:hypothetical protein [Haloplanus vescus]SDZ87084.1 hypothetical protein SAMN04488065_0907 [Haloplanus vescus]